MRSTAKMWRLRKGGSKMMRIKYLKSLRPCFKKCCINMYDTREGGKGGKEEDERENKETMCDRV